MKTISALIIDVPSVNKYITMSALGYKVENKNEIKFKQKDLK